MHVIDYLQFWQRLHVDDRDTLLEVLDMIMSMDTYDKCSVCMLYESAEHSLQHWILVFVVCVHNVDLFCEFD